jgi:nucleoside triphosphate pyrophosphatase
VAVRGDLGGKKESVSVPPAPPLLLASTSPQRRAILEQLEIPFDVVAPAYAEEPGSGPLERAAGKAHSVTADDRPVLGVDTEVLFDGELLGKPANETEAEAMLESLSGRTHAVVSGLCLRTAAWEELHAETTLAIQAYGASLVARVEGDFLNVVGLPGGLLVRLLASRFPGVYGFG